MLGLDQISRATAWLRTLTALTGPPVSRRAMRLGPASKSHQERACSSLQGSKVRANSLCRVVPARPGPGQVCQVSRPSERSTPQVPATRCSSEEGNRCDAANLSVSSLPPIQLTVGALRLLRFLRIPTLRQQLVQARASGSRRFQASHRTEALVAESTTYLLCCSTSSYHERLRT